MHQTQHRRRAGVEVEADGDVDEHAQRGNQHGQESVAQQRRAGNRADVVHVAVDGGVRVLRLQRFGNGSLHALHAVFVNRLDADIDGILACALHGHGVVLQTDTVEHTLDVGLRDGFAHGVLHGHAAGEVNADVDAHAEQAQQQRQHHDAGRNHQALLGVILDCHITWPPLQTERRR